MERLSQLIAKEVQEGRWKAIRLGKSGPPISHIFFADDLVFFAKASMDQMVLFEEVFQIFCESFGQKISKEKIVAFFSHNMRSDQIHALGEEMGVVVTKDLGTYLGVPIINGRITKQTYGYIVDKMKKRIADWASKCL